MKEEDRRKEEEGRAEKRRSCHLLLLAFCLLPSLPASAAPRHQCIVFVLDRTSWFEWQTADMPNLHRLMKHSEVGLMNARTLGDPNPYGSWIALGAGRGAVGRKPIGYAEEWHDQIRYFGLAELKRQNQAVHTGATPGLLGSRLRAAGLRTAIIGNSDPDVVGKGDGRVSATLAMDAQGKVDGGQVGSWLLDVEGGRTRLNLPEFRRWLNVCLRQYDFVVVNFGDTVRADRESPPQSAFRLSPQKAEALSRADEVLGYLLTKLASPSAFSLQPSAFLIVVSPSCPASPHPAVRTMAPLLMTLSGGSGLLRSHSTRQTGIVSTVDFAPTVLSFFGLPIPEEMTGRPLLVVGGQPQSLDTLHRRTATIYRLRYPVLRLYLAAAAALAAALVVLVLRGRRPTVPAVLVRALASFLLTLPASLLLLAAFDVATAPRALVVVFTINLLLAVIALLFRGARARLVFICALTSLAILGDVLLGSPLMKRSVLGFDPIIGNRFYGIGNEFMGVLVAAAAIAAGALWPVRRPSLAPKAALCSALAGVAFVVGAPQLGANWGGGVTAAVAFAGFWLAATGRLRVWKLLAAIAAVLATGFGLILLDIRGAGEHSHFAQAVTEAWHGGLGAMIGRKLEMSLRILRGNPGNYALIGIFLALLAVLVSRRSPARRLLANRVGLKAGLLAAGVGMVAAALINDSGIVAGGCVLAVILPSVIYLAASAPPEEAGIVPPGH